MSPIDTEAETNTRPKKLDLLDDDDSTTQDDDLEGNRSEHKHERGYYSRATPKNAPAPPSSTPLSEISKQFDRDGKGYLDDTEKQLRRMDTQNLGYLPVNKVYSIMEALQKEQKQSGKLLVALERQQKEAINLKKGVIGLAIFSVLLALSNIGTSFAAAKLAKDTTVSKRTGDLEDISTGQRVGVTNKINEITMSPVTPERRRHLQMILDESVCENLGGGTECTVTGEMTFDNAVMLHKQFCQDWDHLNTKNTNQGCPGGGVKEIRLTCNGKVSELYSEGLDVASPALEPNYMDGTWMLFPSPVPGMSYKGMSYLYRQNVDNIGAFPPCKQEMHMGMWCDSADESKMCWVFVAFLQDERRPCFDALVEASNGVQPVGQLCGHIDDYIEGQEEG